MENQKIKSTFLGKITEKTWELHTHKKYSENGYWSKPELLQTTKTIKRDVVEELDMDKPPFGEKQEVYLSKIGKYATIEKVARSTDGSIVYNITYVIENKDVPVSNELKQQLENELKLYDEWKKQYDTKQKEQTRIIEEKKIDKLRLCELLGFITEKQAEIIKDLHEDNNFEKALSRLRNLENK